MPPLPYQVAVLCYLFDREGRVLLLHRRKPPNLELYSPIGGKLEQSRGESPLACALRETREEAGVELEVADLHLTGIVSENGYQGQSHWLMFLYEGLKPVTAEPRAFNEGVLEWHSREAIERLPLPETDRHIIWPLFWRYRGRFFCAHVDCEGPQGMRWRLEQPAADAGDWCATAGR